VFFLKISNVAAWRSTVLYTGSVIRRAFHAEVGLVCFPLKIFLCMYWCYSASKNFHPIIFLIFSSSHVAADLYKNMNILCNFAQNSEGRKHNLELNNLLQHSAHSLPSKQNSTNYKTKQIDMHYILPILIFVLK
jgi:hypothetical protein